MLTSENTTADNPQSAIAAARRRIQPVAIGLDDWEKGTRVGTHSLIEGRLTEFTAASIQQMSSISLISLRGTPKSR